MNNKKKFQSGNVYLITLILVFIGMIIAGIGVYLWQNKQTEGKISKAVNDAKEDIINSIKKEENEVQDQENKDIVSESGNLEVNEEQMEIDLKELNIAISYPAELGSHSKVLKSNLMDYEEDRGITIKFQKPLLFISFERKGFAFQKDDFLDYLTPDKVPYEIGIQRSIESYCAAGINQNVKVIDCEVVNVGIKSKGVLREEMACVKDPISATINCFFYNNLIFETGNPDYPVGIVSMNMGRYDYSENCEKFDLANDRCYLDYEIQYSFLREGKEMDIELFEEVIRGLNFYE